MCCLNIGSADKVIQDNYKTHTTSIRWSNMIYEVVEDNWVLNECGLICLGRFEKKCQFFISFANKCYLGNFDNTAPAAGALTGTHELYINYGMTWTHFELFKCSFFFRLCPKST